MSELPVPAISFVETRALCVLVVEQHRHYEHENVLVLRLCRRNNKSCAAWVGELYGHLLAVQVVEYFVNSASLEAYVHCRAVIVACNALLCACCEIDVFR